MEQVIELDNDECLSNVAHTREIKEVLVMSNKVHAFCGKIQPRKIN